MLKFRFTTEDNLFIYNIHNGFVFVTFVFNFVFCWLVSILLHSLFQGWEDFHRMQR